MSWEDANGKGMVGRVLRLPLRLIPKGATVPIMRGPLRGKRWVAGSSTHGWWLGMYELDKQMAFSKYVRPNDIVYDFGANVGFYSLLASSLVGPAGQVHSFEPFPDNVIQIQKHLDLNHISNCTIHASAISDFNGFASFETSSVSNAMGHLSESEGFKVPVITVDEIVASKTAPPPNVIKCDVEGSEYQMFKGAINVLTAYKPTIFLATHSPELRQQCHDFLHSLGYKLEQIGDEPVSESDETLALFPANSTFPAR